MINIRSIKTTDLDQIAQIEFESFLDPYPVHLFYYLAEKAPDLFLVAVESKKEKEVLLGYIVAEIDQLSGFNRGHILSLAVSRVNRRKGIGHQLFSALIEIFKNRECREVILEVRVSNNSAKDFYQKHNFREIKRSRKYYEDGEDALVMTLNLEDPL